VEKIPLFLLSIAASAVAVWAASETQTPGEPLPFWWRIGNALISYVAYLGQFFCPLGLAAFYPRPGLDLPIWKICGAFFILAAITAGSWVCRRRYPYLLMGWLWYLVMLVPAIGLVQVGIGAMADRFSYLPHIGLCIALVWGAAELLRRRPFWPWAWGIAAASVLAVLMGCAWRQTSFWRDSETMWTRTLACTSQNFTAHNNLGQALAGQGRIDDAMAHYHEALKIKPDYAEALNNLGVALFCRGRLPEAIAQYRKALEAQPDYASALNNLGGVLAGLGRTDEAITNYRRAAEIEPDSFEAHNNLAIVLANRDRFDEALAQYRRALELKPDSAETLNNLGYLFARLGRFDEAITQYQQAVEIKPELAEPHNNLGIALARRGLIDDALAQYRQAVQLKPDYVQAHDNLGNALASRGQIAEALAHYRQALILATQQNNRALADVLRARIARCEAGSPLSQPRPTAVQRPPKP
jgi:Flp pilus assembly protein TadD